MAILTKEECPHSMRPLSLTEYKGNRTDIEQSQANREEAYLQRHSPHKDPQEIIVISPL